MSKLYPIGTQLITRRLSQAALYMEIFNVEPYPLIEGERGNFKPFINTVPERDCWLADAWQGTVTEETQQRASLIEWDEVIEPEVMEKKPCI